jgi:Subtilase family
MSEQPHVGRVNLSKAQFEKVKDALPDGVGLERFPAEPNAPDVVWQADHILVSHDIDVNHDDLRPFDAKLDPPDQQVRDGYVKLLKVNRGADHVYGHLNALNHFKGRVFLNHLLSICPVNLCPGDEPMPVPPAAPPKPAWNEGSMDGQHATVRVIDTGMADGWRDGHRWLTTPDPSEVDGDPNPNDGAEIELYGGHGEFIAGVLRCVAPRAEVWVSDELKWAGAATEFDIRNAILDTLAGKKHPVPHVIVLSAGCTTLDGNPPQALKEVVDRMSQPDCTTLLVAAAGNDGLGPGDGPGGQFYPAAFAGTAKYAPFVVAVGALRGDRAGRACFSNFENWVSVYEDGERLVNAFPTGKYTYVEPHPVPPACIYGPPTLYPNCTCITAPQQGDKADFQGMAKWSGTSFATPIVAARIAKGVTATVNARQVWQTLKPTIVSFPDGGDGAMLRKFP